MTKIYSPLGLHCWYVVSQKICFRLFIFYWFIYLFLPFDESLFYFSLVSRCPCITPVRFAPLGQENLRVSMHPTYEETDYYFAFQSLYKYIIGPISYTNTGPPGGYDKNNHWRNRGNHHLVRLLSCVNNDICCFTLKTFITLSGSNILYAFAGFSFFRFSLTAVYLEWARAILSSSDLLSTVSL